MSNDTVDLSTKGALSQALQDAISPGVNAVSIAVDATYGPQALGYKEPSARNLPTEPPEFSREFVLRYDWYECSVHPLVDHVRDIADESKSGVEESFKKVLKRVLAEDCAPSGQGTLPDVPDEAKAVLRQSVQDALALLQQYQALQPEPVSN